VSHDLAYHSNLKTGMMAAENFILKYIQVDVVDYFSQYYCFYCIFFINAALVSIKVFFQKH